eukprot:g49805.t1
MPFSSLFLPFLPAIVPFPSVTAFVAPLSPFSTWLLPVYPADERDEQSSIRTRTAQKHGTVHRRQVRVNIKMLSSAREPPQAR